MNPASTVIKKLGGAQKVADLLGVKSKVTIYRWTHSKCKGGTDGKIPMHHAKKILQIAKDNNVKLTAEDLIS